MKEQCSVTHNWHLYSPWHFLVVSSQIITLVVVEMDYYYHCSSDTLDRGPPVPYIMEAISLCSWH